MNYELTTQTIRDQAEEWTLTRDFNVPRTVIPERLLTVLRVMAACGALEFRQTERGTEWKTK